MLRLLATASMGLIASAATAKTFDLPRPTIAVTIPDKWLPQPIEDGVEANSPDDELYVAVEVFDGNDAAEAIAEGLKGIAENNIQIDQKSVKRDKAELNGLKGLTVTGAGRDKDGPITIMMKVFEVTRGKSVLVTAWGTPDGAEANKAALQAILQSLKPSKAGS